MHTHMGTISCCPHMLTHPSLSSSYRNTGRTQTDVYLAQCPLLWDLEALEVLAMHGQGVCPASVGGGTGVTDGKTHGLASLLLALTETTSGVCIVTERPILHLNFTWHSLGEFQWCCIQRADCICAEKCLFSSAVNLLYLFISLAGYVPLFRCCTRRTKAPNLLAPYDCLLCVPLAGLLLCLLTD